MPNDLIMKRKSNSIELHDVELDYSSGSKRDKIESRLNNKK
jgi:hypothetical protein